MLWDINEIQFARLLCEIVATQRLELPELANLMDLELCEVDQLLDRANKVWEKSKADVDESHRVKSQLQAVIKENEKLEGECDGYSRRITHLEAVLRAREDQLTAKADYIKSHQNQLRTDRHNIAAKLGLTCASTWEEIYDEVTKIRHTNGTLSRELNKELERYAKLDDVRYELEVKLKRERDKDARRIKGLEEAMDSMRRYIEGLEKKNANMKEALRQQVVDGMIEDDAEPYVGDAPYRVQGLDHSMPYQKFIQTWHTAHIDFQRAKQMGISNPRIYDKNDDDVTEAVCKVHGRSEV